MVKIGIVVSSFAFITREMFHALVKARQENDHVYLFVCSSDRATTFKMPFEKHHRADNLDHLLASNDDLDKVNFSIVFLHDNPINKRQWISDIHHKFDSRVRDVYLDKNKMDVNVYVSEETKHPYEDIFAAKNFTVHRVNMGEPNDELLRDFYGMEDISSHIAPNMWKLYDDFRKTEEFDKFKTEYKVIKYQAEQWTFAPFPPTFVTTDAVVYYKGYVLVVKRKGPVGNSLYCLPGGYLSQDDTIEEGVVKNLKKDTNIQVHESILKSTIRKVKTYDDPRRSDRGRIITNAGLIDLDTVTTFNDFPKVRKTKSQKEHAGWFSLHEIEKMRSSFFEDHFYIIKDLLSQ